MIEIVNDVELLIALDTGDTVLLVELAGSFNGTNTGVEIPVAELGETNVGAKPPLAELEESYCNINMIHSYIKVIFDISKRRNMNVTLQEINKSD